MVAVLAAVALLGIVFELTRRRLVGERYSLVWLLTGAALLALAVWRPALRLLAEALGIHYSPVALLLVGVGFILLILLHFSVVITRLSRESRILAQRYAELRRQLEDMEERQRVL